MGLLGFGEFGWFAAEPAFGFGDLHAFAGAGADEVGFEFGDHGQDVEEQPADGVVYMGFFAAGERVEGVAVGDRLTGAAATSRQRYG